MQKNILFTLAGLIVIQFSHAQSAGSLDSSFNNSTGYYSVDFGFHDNINDITVQPDDKIIGTGVALANGTYYGTLKVFRLNSDGTPDLTFANNGLFSFSVTQETYGIASAIRPDGKIVVAGLAAYTFG